MPRSRLSMRATIVSLLLGALPATAFGHGGQFRGPPGSIPPGLRPPQDPLPPPLPPPTDQPPPVTDSPEGRPPPATGTPTQPPPPPPTTGELGGGERPRGAKPALGHDSWIFWWTHNDAEILRLKEEIYRRRGSPGSPLGALAASGGSSVSDATRPTEQENRKVVVPALLRVMAEARREGARPIPDTESAAYLALAKVTEDPGHARRLTEAAAAIGSQGPPQMVRESAALALGLLRRTHPTRQFDAKVYDQARDDAFALFEDDRLATRTRAFAAIAIGLLGDMPTNRGPAPTDGATPVDPALGTRDAAARLFALLRERYASPDLPIALLAGLSLQPTTSVTAEMQDALESAALRGRMFGQQVHDYTSAWAAHALGRVGGPSRARPLLLAMSSRSLPTEVRRSAAIAVGRLALRADGVERAELAEGIVKAIESSKDALTRSFGTMGLARLLADEASHDAMGVLRAKDGKVAQSLVTLAETGPHGQRPYGALALGIVLRSLGHHPGEEWSRWSVGARAALRTGFSDRGLDARSRGAFAVGLGLAHEESATKELAAVVADRRDDHELRGWCATGLGLVGLRSPEIVAVVKKALLEKSSEELRLQCATALGLLGVSEAVDLLVAELGTTDNVTLQGPIVLALARVGDARALAPLVVLLEDPTRSDGGRAMACAGLGLVGDLEPLSTLTRLSSDVNYVATSDAIREFLSIL